MAELAPNQVAVDKAVMENLMTLHGIMDKLMSPEAKADFEPVFKKHVNKDYVTDKERAAPHVNPILERLEAMEKKFNGLDNDKIDERLAAAFKRLKDNHNVTDDGIETIKKFMLERRIADPEDAWFAFKGREPPTASIPNGMTPSSWGFQDTSDEDSKAIWSDGPEFDNYLARVWNDAKR